MVELQLTLFYQRGVKIMYKAMIVDDEEMIRKGIFNFIQWNSLGISEVRMASSGIEALDLMKESKVDIMITDICMREMNGLDLVKKVNSLNEKTRIIVLTGYDSFEYAQKCCKMRVDDYILKPVDEIELEKTVKRLIDDIKNEKARLFNEKINSRISGLSEQLKIEQIMQNLIYKRIKADNTEEVLDYLDKDGDLQIAIVVPFIDDNPKWKQHFELLNLSIKNACIEVFDCNKEGITFEDENKNIIIAMFLNSRLKKTNKNVENLVQYLKREYNIKPKIILGSIVNELDRVNISYNDAFRLLKKEKAISFEENDVKGLSLFSNRIQKIRSTMMENIENLEKVMDTFESFIETVDVYNLSKALVKKSCFDIGCGVYFSCIDKDIEIKDNIFNSFLMSLQTCNTNDEVKITRDFILNLLKADIGESHEIIRKAKLYINGHLNEDISVYSISEKLYLSPTYFSKLFKHITGEGCNSYIIRKRIEKAKSLLNTTSMKAGKIATLVGYKDTNYFSLAFKKQTGMSPTEYRESLIK